MIRSTFCHVTDRLYTVLSVQIGHTAVDHGVFDQLLILSGYVPGQCVCVCSHQSPSIPPMHLSPVSPSYLFRPVVPRHYLSVLICPHWFPSVPVCRHLPRLSPSILVCTRLSSFVPVCPCLFPTVHTYSRQLPSVSNTLYTISPVCSTCVFLS